MNRIRSFSGIALLLLLITGCNSTRRINQFERFADAGKSYTDAMIALTDESARIAVDANSEMLLFIRDDLPSEEDRTEEFRTHTDTLQALLSELTLLQDHALLLKRYFTTLAELAGSDASSGAGAQAETLTSRLQALHPRLEEVQIGGAPVKDFVGDAVPIAVAAFQQAALERELRKNASTIERELELQNAFLQALAEGMKDDLQTIARIRGVNDLARPYIREARLPASWMKDRQQVLLTSTAVGSADSAMEAAGQLKVTFVKLVENRVGPGDFDDLLADVNSMLDLIELVQFISSDSEN